MVQGGRGCCWVDQGVILGSAERDWWRGVKRMVHGGTG